MGNIVHTSHITITRDKGPTRIAEIKGFAEPVFYGVHGGIKDFYKVDPEKENRLEAVYGLKDEKILSEFAIPLPGILRMCMVF